MAQKRRARTGPKGKAGKKGRAKPAGPGAPWAGLTLALTLAVLALRLGVDALEPIPVHFAEAEAWAYGRELDWGYFATPPLTAWLIRAATELGGDSLFMLRLASPVAHALIAWLMFLTGRRLWDEATGFWASLGYTAAPGVALSSMIMSPEPVVIACWAAALYATVRAAEGGSRIWWAGLGLTTGAGLLAGYGMIAFVAGLAGYGLLSARGRDWTGAGIAAAVALVVVAPTLAWSAGHGGAALAGAIGDLQPGQGDFRLRGLAVFVAAQVALIGPVFLVAIGLALRNAGVWRDDWGMRLMAWVTAPLLLATTACALAVPTPPGWAAPAYVGGALMAARWLVLAGGLPALRAQIAVGVAASLALWGAAGLYAGNAEALTRRLDPFREMRLAEPYCELVLGVMAEEGVGVMLSDDRRRLSECMFYGGLGWDEVAVWNPDRRPDTHHELMATLYPGDAREMLLVVRQDARRFTRHFAEAREVETGAIETHKDRSVPFSIWVVQGFKGY